MVALRVAVGDEFSDPVLDVVEPDGTDRHGSEDRQNKVARYDSSRALVDVRAFELAGLDRDEESFGVYTTRKVLRALNSGRVAPAGLPRRVPGSVDDSADRRHKHLLRAHGNRFL